MTSSMDIDFDVPKFLNEARVAAPPELQDYYRQFEDLHERKLWHQLTELVLEFFDNPASASSQINIFKHFVAEWKNNVKPLSLAKMALKAANQFKDPRDSVEFLGEIIAKFDPKNNDDAKTKSNVSKVPDVYAHLLMESAHFKLQLQKVDEVKAAIEESEKILDRTDNVDTVIYASFYRVSSEYYQSQNDYVKYYKISLLYLACINMEDLSEEEKKTRAYDLSLSALLGDTIYNFGELLMHPILDSMKGNEHDWLRSLLLAFNSGDIGKYQTLKPQFKAKELKDNANALEQKIYLMALIETVFREGDKRALPFVKIAASVKLAVENVEDLVMKALSLNLIRGSIDQVAQVVTVTWVQPRVLDMEQIKGMGRRLEIWNDKVKTISAFVSDPSKHDGLEATA